MADFVDYLSFNGHFGVVVENRIRSEGGQGVIWVWIEKGWTFEGSFSSGVWEKGH